MLGLSGEESGLFHIPNKNEKTVNSMKICAYCGTQSSGDAKYCTRCGREV